MKTKRTIKGEKECAGLKPLCTIITNEKKLMVRLVEEEEPQKQMVSNLMLKQVVDGAVVLSNERRFAEEIKKGVQERTSGEVVVSTEEAVREFRKHAEKAYGKYGIESVNTINSKEQFQGFLTDDLLESFSELSDKFDLLLSRENEKSIQIVNHIVTAAESVDFSGAGMEEFAVYKALLYFRGEKMMNLWIQIEKMLAFEDGDALYEVSVFINGEKRTRKLKPELFRNPKWIKSESGLVTFTSEKLDFKIARYLNTCVARFFEEKKQVQPAFKFSGWKFFEDKGWRYISTHDEPFETQRIVAEKGISLKAPEKGEISSVIREFLEFQNLTKNDTGLILLLYLVMSFMFTFFKEAGFRPKFSVFVAGERGSRKTALINAVICGKGSGSEAEFRFSDTQSSIENAMAEHQDAVLFVDDLCPSLSRANVEHMQKNLEILVRTYGDGAARKRNLDFANLQAGEKIKQFTCNGGLVMSGEYTTGVASSVARSLYLDLTKDSVDLEKLGMVQRNPDIRAKSLYLITHFVALSWNKLQKYSSDRIFKIRAEYERDFSNARYAEYAAILMVTSEILYYIAEKLGAISKEELLNLLSRAKRAIYAVVSSNDKKHLEISPLFIIRQAITERFQDGEIILEQGVFYLKAKEFLDIIWTYMSSKGITVKNFDESQVKNLLASHEYLIRPEGAEKNRYTVKHNGIRVWKISSQILLRDEEY